MIMVMPLVLRTEPQIRWMELAFVIHDGSNTHILSAYMLTPAEIYVAEALEYVFCDANRMFVSQTGGRGTLAL